MTQDQLFRALSVPMLTAVLLVSTVAPVTAQEAGADRGDVVFRVTLTGAVDPDDEFYVVSRCPDEWCQSQPVAGGPIEHSVVACGPPDRVADATVCSARTFELTIPTMPGTLEYRFFRMRDVGGANEVQLLHQGSWEVHTGRQVLTFVYEYPGGSTAPSALPNTALPAP
jgi:hypothetical protein